MSYQMLVDPYMSTQVKHTKSIKKFSEEDSFSPENSKTEDDSNKTAEKNDSLSICEINQSKKKGIESKLYFYFYFYFYNS